MTANNDQDIQAEISRMFERARIPLAIEVSYGTARVTGSVESEANYQAAMDIVTSFDGIIEVIDEVEFATTSPDSAFDEESVEGDYDFTETPSWSTGDEFEIEPDFIDDEGASARSFQQAVEEAEPYFPPTDPVVRPVEDEEDLEIEGGFQDTSMDELSDEPRLDRTEAEAEDRASIRRDDEAIREDIVRELREDASTADLRVDIEVVNGVVLLRGEVQSLEDALNVEEVAGRVPGIVEVRDETIIQQ